MVEGTRYPPRALLHVVTLGVSVPLICSVSSSSPAACRPRRDLVALG